MRPLQSHDLLLLAVLVGFLCWLFWPRRSSRKERLSDTWKPRGPRDGL